MFNEQPSSTSFISFALKSIIIIDIFLFDRLNQAPLPIYFINLFVVYYVEAYIIISSSFSYFVHLLHLSTLYRFIKFFFRSMVIYDSMIRFSFLFLFFSQQVSCFIRSLFYLKVFFSLFTVDIIRRGSTCVYISMMMMI